MRAATRQALRLQNRPLYVVVRGTGDDQKEVGICILLTHRSPITHNQPLKPMNNPESTLAPKPDPNTQPVSDSVDRIVRDFSQEGYLIVSPSPHKGGLPQIISFRHTHGAADTRAQSLEKAYSKESYPCGLIVVPCSVSFSIPNAAISGGQNGE